MRVVVFDLTGKPRETRFGTCGGKLGAEILVAEDLRVFGDLLNDHPGMHAVVIIEPLADSVAHAIATGAAPEVAIRDCEILVETLERIGREFGDRVAVVEETSDPKTLSALLQKWAGPSPDGTFAEMILPIHLSGPRSGGGRSAYLAAHFLVDEVSAINRITATGMSWIMGESADHRSEALRIVHQRLARRPLVSVGPAKSDARSDVPGPPDPSYALAQDLKNENVGILSQLHEAQIELNNYISANRTQEEKLNALRRGRRYRKAKIAELEVMVKKLTATILDLQGQLDQANRKVIINAKFRENVGKDSHNVETNGRVIPARQVILAAVAYLKSMAFTRLLKETLKRRKHG